MALTSKQLEEVERITSRRFLQHTCVVCQMQYFAVMAKSTYCSPACSAVAYRTRIKAREKPEANTAPPEPKEKKAQEPLKKDKSKVVLAAEQQLKAREEENTRIVSAQLKEAEEILTKTKK